jgi:hypothetical protein
MSIPHSISGKAFDRFGTHTINASEGQSLIEQIEKLDDDIEKLKEYKELHVGTFSNCHFKPAILTDDVRSFALSILSKRRQELAEKFNARFGEKQ